MARTNLEIDARGKVYGFHLLVSPSAIVLSWNPDKWEPFGRDKRVLSREEFKLCETYLADWDELWNDDDDSIAVDWIATVYREWDIPVGTSASFESGEGFGLPLDLILELGILRRVQHDPDICRHTDGDGEPTVPILQAVWAINRRAKRCRDYASSYASRARPRDGDGDLRVLASWYRMQKESLYELKGQALHHLLKEGLVQRVGYAIFEDDNWAEVLAGGGYRFHRPCEEPGEEIPDEQIVELDQIEAKPKETAEPDIADAIASVEAYLDDKPAVQLYSWPPPQRQRFQDDVPGRYAFGRSDEYEDRYDEYEDRYDEYDDCDDNF